MHRQNTRAVVSAQAVTVCPAVTAWCGDRNARSPAEAEQRLRADCELVHVTGPAGLFGLIVACMSVAPTEAAKIRKMVRRCADIDPGLARKLRAYRMGEGVAA